MAENTKNWIESRERDWNPKPADEKVVVEAGELQALLAMARNMMALMDERRHNFPGMQRRPASAMLPADVLDAMQDADEPPAPAPGS